MDVETCFNSFSVIGKYAIYCIFSLLFGRHFIKWIIYFTAFVFIFFLWYPLVITGKRKKVWSKSLCLIQPLVMGFSKITLVFNFAWAWFWQSPWPLSLHKISIVWSCWMKTHFLSSIMDKKTLNDEYLLPNVIPMGSLCKPLDKALIPPYKSPVGNFNGTLALAGSSNTP
jgi:hypothetical protein